MQVAYLERMNFVHNCAANEGSRAGEDCAPYFQL